MVTDLAEVFRLGTAKAEENLAFRRYLCAHRRDLPAETQRRRDRLARLGFVRGEDGSLAETLGRCLGITGMELRRRLQRRAAGQPAELPTDIRS